jgi:hypothetical protein
MSRELGLTDHADRLVEARYYLRRLGELDDRVVNGGPSADEALREFDIDASTYRSYQGWAHDRVATDADAAGLCRDFSQLAGTVVSLRLAPLEAAAWHRAGVEGAVRANDPVGLCVTLGNWAVATAAAGHPGVAGQGYYQAYRLAVHLGW